jgi:hypothetical protein
MFISQVHLLCLLGDPKTSLALSLNIKSHIGRFLNYYSERFFFFHFHFLLLLLRLQLSVQCLHLMRPAVGDAFSTNHFPHLVCVLACEKEGRESVSAFNEACRGGRVSHKSFFAFNMCSRMGKKRQRVTVLSGPVKSR